MNKDNYEDMKSNSEKDNGFGGKNDDSFDDTVFSEEETTDGSADENSESSEKKRWSEFEARQNARRTARKRKKIRFIVIILAIIVTVALVGTAAYIDKKGYANVNTIVVTGNSYYDTVTIIEASKAVTDVGLISLNTGKLANNLKRLPYIKSVKITKRFPHTLKIHVEEREAKYAVYAGGCFFLLDKDLAILAKTNDPANLVIIEGFLPEDPQVGKTFVADDEINFKQSMELLKALTEKGLSVYKISYRNSMTRLYITKNIVCQGKYENLIKYVDAINEILYSLQTQGVERATIYIGNNEYISFSPKIE